MWIENTKIMKLKRCREVWTWLEVLKIQFRWIHKLLGSNSTFGEVWGPAWTFSTLWRIKVEKIEAKRIKVKDFERWTIFRRQLEVAGPNGNYLKLKGQKVQENGLDSYRKSGHGSNVKIWRMKDLYCKLNFPQANLARPLQVIEA